jgi:hemolysin activation/secretion protein
VATLRVITSGSGLQYARASYHLQVGRGKVGVAFSGLRYELGREFEALGAHGTARVASLYGSYPLVRSRSSNLYLLGNLDAKRFRDVVDSTGAVSEKDARVATVALHGDHTDGIAGGGVNAWSVALSAGDIDLRTPADRAADAATARTQGGFGKLAFSATRLQAVSDRLSLYVSANGQLASENLDVSEKMQLGGMYAVRAYPEGEAYADEGVVLSAELRWLMPPWRDAQDGRLYLIGFVDAGAVTTNKEPWLAGRNRRTLSGAGVGVNWFGANDLEVKAYYAFKLGNEAATSAPDRSGRFWVQAVKYF